MNTDSLMSSIREMVKAEVMVTLLDTHLLTMAQETADLWRAQYSRHETAVRTGLAQLGKEAASYKPEPRFR